MSWLSLQTKLYTAGAFALAVLAFFVRLRFVTAQRDRAQIEADTLKAALHVQVVRKKIIKDISKEEYDRRVILLKELKKDDKDFKGIDNLTNSNTDL